MKRRWYILTYLAEGGTQVEKEWIIEGDTCNAPIIKDKVIEWLNIQHQESGFIPHFSVMSCPWKD